MMDSIGTVGQGLLSGFFMLLLASLACSLLYPFYSRLQARLSIAHQALSTLSYALIAPVSALLGVAVLSHPAISAAVVYAHCHGNSCAAHVPASIMNSLSGAGLGAAVTLLALVVFYMMSKKIQTARAKQLFLDALAFAPTTQGDKNQLAKPTFLPYQLIESDDLLAWCAGLLFPKVYLSSGLLNKLNHVQLNAVLAHEYGHVSRRDNLRKLLLNWSTVVWLPRHKKRIQQNFKGQTEQLSDLYSAQITGDPQLVNQVYALFRSVRMPQQAQYAHRDTAAQASQSDSPASTILTMVVYTLSSLMFVLITLGLTIATHVLLEQL